jgi:hypothetical protein
MKSLVLFIHHLYNTNRILLFSLCGEFLYFLDMKRDGLTPWS